MQDEREELLDYMSEVDDEPGEVRLIGKWRKNGDAIEPKWRDGDTVPLVPFDAVKESRLHQRPFLTNENKTDTRKLRQRIRRLRPGSVKRVQYPNLEKTHEENNNSFQVNPHEYELADELNEYQKPRPRKRRPPQNYEYPPSSPITIPQLKNFNREKMSENTELKSLLKMQEFEGLSLSEILQAKNLSLSDLLRGKANALSALKIPEEFPKTQGESPRTQEKLPKIPEEFSKEKIENITVKSIDENFTNRPKRGRISQVKIDGARVGGSVRRKFEGGLRRRIGNFTRSRPIVVETTTILLDPVGENQDGEKGESSEMIVTTTGGGKPLENDEMLEFSDFIDKNKRNATNKIEQVLRVGKEEDSTLSIERVAFGVDGATVIDEKSSEISQKSSEINEKSSQIDRSSAINETNSVGFDDLDVNNSKSDGKYLKNEEQAPKLEEMTSNIDEKSVKLEKTIEITTIKNEVTTLTELETTTEEPEPKNHQGLPPSNRIYEKIISEIEPEAREEILDLFENNKNTDILKNLLESRNMSIDELISLRQRGSSRVHLAQVTPARKIIPRPPPIKPFLYFNLTSFSKTTTEKSEKSSPVIIDLSPKNHDKFERKNYDKESMELVDILSAFESLPFSIKKILSNQSTTETKMIENIDNKNEGDLNIVEENFFDVDDEITTTFKLPNDFESFDDNKQKIIDKIKPSIYASIAILVMTIIGFFGIFIICKIRQKQKYIYSNAFSRGVFHTPVINPRKLSNSSSLNTIMVNVVTTTGINGRKFGDNCRREMQEMNHSFDGDYEGRSDIDNDSLDANDSWDTIPDFMK